MDFAAKAAPTGKRGSTMSSSLDVKERIKQAVDIVDLVERYVRLRRQGHLFVGLCPWHDDTRPSLQVNPERQSFRCWVCDIGGDVFTFVQKIENVEFREALEMLAERAGIALESPTRDSTAASGVAVDKRALLKAAAWAEEQYHRCLVESDEAASARAYLADRGISAESIAAFRLGYSPEVRDWIIARARLAQDTQRTEQRLKMLEAIGVLARSPAMGGLYDRFRGRVLFSIRDAQGRPVGLGGRVLPGPAATNAAKYVNSPDTPLFTKSRLLYGLDRARDAIRRTRTAVIVEGYTDVIMAHQFGFTQVAAVLGTALGEEHVRILRRLADRVVLVLDGDEAGRRRATEVLDLFVAHDVDLAVVTLPGQLDPCDFLRREGAEAFGEWLERRAVGALDHAFEVATFGVDLERDLAGADRALERILSVIAKAPRSAALGARQQAREWRILSNLAMRFRLPEDTLRRRLKELRRPTTRRGGGLEAAVKRPATSESGAAAAGKTVSEAPTGAAGDRTAQPLDPWERALLELLLFCPDLVPTALGAIGADWPLGATCRAILETQGRLAAAGDRPDFERLMLEFDDAAIKGLLVVLDEEGRQRWSAETEPAASLAGLLKTFEQREVERRRPERIGALRQAGLESSQQSLLLEDIIRQERNRQGISEPTDG